jgi:hypothetical protein
MMDNRFKSYWIIFGISTIIVDTIDDKLLLFGVQKAVRLSGEVDDKEPAYQAQSYSNRTFDDEYPWKYTHLGV